MCPPPQAHANSPSQGHTPTRGSWRTWLCLPVLRPLLSPRGPVSIRRPTYTGGFPSLLPHYESLPPLHCPPCSQTLLRRPAELLHLHTLHPRTLLCSPLSLHRSGPQGQLRSHQHLMSLLRTCSAHSGARSRELGFSAGGQRPLSACSHARLRRGRGARSARQKRSETSAWKLRGGGGAWT